MRTNEKRHFPSLENVPCIHDFRLKTGLTLTELRCTSCAFEQELGVPLQGTDIIRNLLYFRQQKQPIPSTVVTSASL